MAPGHTTAIAHFRPSSDTFPYFPSTMRIARPASHPPYVGFALNVHGQPQLQLHATTCSSVIRHFAGLTMSRPLPAGTIPAQIHPGTAATPVTTASPSVLHSPLSTATGSTLVALRPGTYVATSATAPRIAAIVPNVPGSPGAAPSRVVPSDRLTSSFIVRTCATGRLRSISRIALRRGAA